jgi:hypothetical protein
MGVRGLCRRHVVHAGARLAVGDVVGGPVEEDRVLQDSAMFVRSVSTFQVAQVGLSSVAPARDRKSGDEVRQRRLASVAPDGLAGEPETDA